MGTDVRTNERTNGHKDHYIPPQICGGYNESKENHQIPLCFLKMSLTTVDVIFEKSQLRYVTTNQRPMEGTSTVYTPIYNWG